jgi:DNA invertase Pin-like site-specific DNA recombinase
VALPETYDDGGFTGANMDRPALHKLLDEIAAGRVDCVVVYKVDRLRGLKFHCCRTTSFKGSSGRPDHRTVNS